jgi:hypothetical protein
MALETTTPPAIRRGHALCALGLFCGLAGPSCDGSSPPLLGGSGGTRDRTQSTAPLGRISFGSLTRAAPTGPYTDESLHPLGRVGAGHGVRLRLSPREESGARDVTYRIFLDLDGDHRISDRELVRETTVTGSQDVDLPLADEQRLALHGDHPRTVMVRVAARDLSGAAEQIIDYSLIFDGRPLAIRPIRLASGEVRGETLPEPIRIVPGRHHLVQFARIPTAEEAAQLAESGVTLLGYLPERSWWARITAAPGELELAGGLSVALPAASEHKLHSAIDVRDPAPIQVAVYWFADATAEEKAAAQAEIGPVGAGNDGRYSDYTVLTAAPSRLQALARLEAVQWIEPHAAETTLHSSTGNNDHNVTPLFGAPYNLDGAGIQVAVFDAGWIDETHPDLAGRVFHDGSLLDTKGNPISNTTSTGAHATHMAGIIGSSGAGNALAKGSAPATQLYSYREAYRYQAINDMVASQSALYGWRVANHAYGSGWPCSSPDTEPCKSSPLWTSYIQDARDADTWSYRSGVLSVYSAGNDGCMKNDGGAGWESDNWSTIYSGAAGKNVLAVCAASRGTYGRESYNIKLDSSKGPASDGRVKPDLCAEGAGVSDSGSTWTTDLGGGYVTTVGTSPAAAQVTGIVALLCDAYRDLAGPTAMMPPDLARALLIQTAVDLVESNTYRWWNAMFPSYAAAGPDYTTGYGYADAQAAVDTLRLPARYRSGSVGQGQMKEVEVSVPSAASLKVTLAWTDPPAAVGGATALVNDLDLEVEALATGSISYPWVLDKNAPMTAASTGVNVVDNVEQVVLTNSTASTQVYRIRVKGTSVPQGPQAFHVVSSHDITDGSSGNDGATASGGGTGSGGSMGSGGTTGSGGVSGSGGTTRRDGGVDAAANRPARDGCNCSITQSSRYGTSFGLLALILLLRGRRRGGERNRFNGWGARPVDAVRLVPPTARPTVRRSGCRGRYRPD